MSVLSRMFSRFFSQVPFYHGFALRTFRMEQPMRGIPSQQLFSKKLPPPRPRLRIMFPDRVVPRVRSNEQERRALRRERQIQA